MAAEATTPGRCRRGALCAAVVLVAGGCQTTTTRSLPTTATPPTPITDADLQQLAPPPSVPAGGGSVSADDAVGTSPSAVRLEAVEGPLLMYLGVHHRMPPSLADLQPLNGPVPTADPAGRSYLYVPLGLVTTGSNRRIVVAEAAPSAGGARWCILLPPAPPAGGAALSASVVSVPEAVFQRYVPAE